MTRETLRAFLAASAFAALGVLGAGSAVGQEVRVELEKEQIQKILTGFGFVTPNGNELCHDARPAGSTPRCIGHGNPVGCTCFSIRGVQGIARIDATGKVNLEFQGLAPHLSQEIMKKTGASPEKK